MADAPVITIGHHPHAGVVAAPTDDHHVTDHLLRRVGFEPIDGSRLYTLTDPHHDPVRRTQLAVQSLRAAHQTVTADDAFDLHPGQHPPPPGGPANQAPLTASSPQARRAQAAASSSPAHTATAAPHAAAPVESPYRPAPAAARQPAHHR